MACAYGLSSRLASTSLVDDEFDQLVLNKHIEGTADTVGTFSEELALAELCESWQTSIVLLPLDYRGPVHLRSNRR
jgi:hypothetical protein